MMLNTAAAQYKRVYLLECKEKATSDNNKAQCQRKDTALSGQHDASIAKEPIFSRENFPFPPYRLRFLLGLVLRRWRCHGQRPRVDLLVFAVPHRSRNSEVAKGTQKQNIHPSLGALSRVTVHSILSHGTFTAVRSTLRWPSDISSTATKASCPLRVRVLLALSIPEKRRAFLPSLVV